MNVDEIAQVAARIARIWKIYDDPERRTILVKDLQQFDYLLVSSAIDHIIKESKTNVAPSIEEIVGYVRASRSYEKATGLCRLCDNSGWIIIDEIGHGISRRCECEGRFEHRNDNLGLTTEGHPIASPQEKYDAIVRGFLGYKPDVNQTEIEEHLGRFGLDGSIDIPTHNVTESEIF